MKKLITNNDDIIEIYLNQGKPPFVLKMAGLEKPAFLADHRSF